MFLVTDQTGAILGSSNGEFTSDENGHIVIPNLEPGMTVTVRGISVPDGVVLDSSPKSILIKVGEQGQTLQLVNQETGYLVIKKLDKLSSEPLAGVEFKLSYASGEYVDDNFGHLSSLGLFKTDANGEIRVPVVGTVVVEETKPLPNYTIDPGTKRQVVTVHPADTQTLTVYNTTDTNLTIQKHIEDPNAKGTGTEPLAGVTFLICDSSGTPLGPNNGEFVTDQLGQIRLSVAPGTTIKELKTASNEFVLDFTPYYFSIQDNQCTTLTVTNKAFSGIIIRKINSVTEDSIYDVKFLPYDENKNPIGQYSTDCEGYIYIEDLTVQGKGRLYLHELEAAPGYELDKEYKTIYLQPGKTVEIEWENTPITTQIQVIKYAAEYNEVTSTPARTPLQGAVYEISDPRSNKVVDYITTDARGIAASKPLPLGRYKIVEVTAPAYWQLSKTVFDETLEYFGQIIKVSDYDKPAGLGVTITKRGNVEVLSGTGCAMTSPSPTPATLRSKISAGMTGFPLTQPRPWSSAPAPTAPG